MDESEVLIERGSFTGKKRSALRMVYDEALRSWFLKCGSALGVLPGLG